MGLICQIPQSGIPNSAAKNPFLIFLNTFELHLRDAQQLLQPF